MADSVSGLHQELPPEGPHEDPHGREAVPVLLGGLRLEILQVWSPANRTRIYNIFRVRRADPSLQEAHGNQALQMSSLPPSFLKIRSPRASHEETLE